MKKDQLKKLLSKVVLKRMEIVSLGIQAISGPVLGVIIGQTLMKNSKFEGGISGGQFCNAESAQSVLVQTIRLHVID